MNTNLYHSIRRFVSLNSKEWMQRHLKDQFVKKAAEDNYRSRATYKLIEMDQQYNIIKTKTNVLELGSAPGGWTQYMAHKLKVPNQFSKIVAVDIAQMDEVQL